MSSTQLSEVITRYDNGSVKELYYKNTNIESNLIIVEIFDRIIINIIERYNYLLALYTIKNYISNKIEIPSKIVNKLQYL